MRSPLSVSLSPCVAFVLLRARVQPILPPMCTRPLARRSGGACGGRMQEDRAGIVTWFGALFCADVDVRGRGGGRSHVGRREGTTEASEVSRLSPRLSCSDCGVLPGTGCCMCCNVCVCLVCVCNASRRHLPTRTQRRSPTMMRASVMCVAANHWHHPVQGESQPASHLLSRGSWCRRHAHFFLSLFLWWCLWPWPCLWWWPPLLVGPDPEPAAEVGS